MVVHSSLLEVDHRPWPLPEGRWRWRQSWWDLLFAHWPVEASLLRPLVPKVLEIQECEGSSWIGVVPFHMTGVMRRPLPDLPWFSAFPEINLRLYVAMNGRPGVWFLSLDAGNQLAVRAARRWFHLPYWHAEMKVGVRGSRVRYRSRRRRGGASFAASYGATSEPYQAAAGTLEHWLTERYCLYALSPGGTLYRTEVHHPPWPLCSAEAEIECNDLFADHFQPSSRPSALAPPLLHFARRVDVVAWQPVPVGSEPVSRLRAGESAESR